MINQPMPGLTPESGDKRYLKTTGGTMTGNITMGGKKVTGLGTPTEDGDAVNKKYVEDNFVFYASAMNTNILRIRTEPSYSALDPKGYTKLNVSGHCRFWGPCQGIISIWTSDENIAHLLPVYLDNLGGDVTITNPSDSNFVYFLAGYGSGIYTLIRGGSITLTGKSGATIFAMQRVE